MLVYAPANLSALSHPMPDERLSRQLRCATHAPPMQPSHAHAKHGACRPEIFAGECYANGVGITAARYFDPCTQLAMLFYLQLPRYAHVHAVTVPPRHPYATVLAPEGPGSHYTCWAHGRAQGAPAGRCFTAVSQVPGLEG